MFEIGIDTKKLSGESKEAEAHLKGIEERSGKAIEAMEQRGKQSEALFKGMKEEAGGFLSIVAGAFTTAKIAEFAKNNMLGAESLGYMAGNLGMATERLRAWQLAAEKNGGTAAGITGTLQQAAMAVAANQRGQEFPGMREFFAQGGTPEDLKSVESYMVALSRIVQRAYSAGGPSAGMNVASQLGISPESLNLMKQGPGAIQALLKEQEKYAAVSQSWADTSHETLNNFRNIGDSLTKIGTIMLESVNPELRKMAELVERGANFAMQHEAAIKRETPSLLKSAAGAVMGGPLGAIGADLFFPQSTVSQAQEDAAMAQWRMEHGGGGDDKEAYLRQQERNHGLPPGSMSQIWEQESGKGKNKGPSSAGAMGDFQLRPKTWEGYKRPEDDDINDFYQNSAAAARLLDELYNKQFKGDWNATLRWYNAGRNYNGQQAHQYANEVMARPLGKPEVVQSREPEQKSNQFEPPVVPREPFVLMPAEPPKPLVNMPGNEGLRREYPPIGKVDVQVEWPDSRFLMGDEDRKPFVWVPPVETGDEKAGDSPLQNLGRMPFDGRSNDQPAFKVEFPENNYLSEIRNGMQPAASNTTNKTDIQVTGPITINTQATNAEEIKQDLMATVSQHSQMAGMADTGTH